MCSGYATAGLKNTGLAEEASDLQPILPEM